MDTFDAHAADSLATAGYFALRNLSGEINVTRKYIPDMNSSITSCLNNKTHPNNCMNMSYTINASLWQIAELGRTNFSVTTTYDIERVWISEEKPFEVVLWMNISYNVSDPYATWQIKSKTIRADVDVTGIDDPAIMYAFANGALRFTRTINPTPYRRHEFNNNTFRTYYLSKQYTQNPGNNTIDYRYAPSMIMRYTGNLTAGSVCCGIETILQTGEIVPFNANNITNSSYVDYLFLSRETIPPFSCLKKENTRFNATAFTIDPSLRMDTYHAFNVFNVSDHLTYNCNFP
jgi:hypothetical protein